MDTKRNKFSCNNYSIILGIVQGSGKYKRFLVRHNWQHILDGSQVSFIGTEEYKCNASTMIPNVVAISYAWKFARRLKWCIVGLKCVIKVFIHQI